MRKPKPQAALPKINAVKDDRHWRVDWDYQEAPESRILTKRAEFLDGYVCGILATLGVSAGELCRPSARTGTVRRVDEATALKLAQLLKSLLHPVVEEEHRRLLNEADLPHVRFQAEQDAVKTSETR
ncbi:hypothetical protein [Pseudomonas sp. KCJK8993]|uniref:hypothetical protein n=1 Tax=Pseudomonas sp. KCJK8993 TaxID=3344565 RepID=UPI003905B52D